MSEEPKANDITKKTVVYNIPGMNDVNIKNVVYKTQENVEMIMDLYSSPNKKNDELRPVVIFVFGYPGLKYGEDLKKMGAYISWGKLIAASGMHAISYSYRDPVVDLQALLQYLKKNAEVLGIDENRIAIWSCSGNVPTALSVLMQEKVDYFKCAVLSYGFMLDLNNSTRVAEAAAKYGFANPCAGKTISEFPKQLPLFILRAGLDEIPHLNETIDLFIAEAISNNLPITFVNHPHAPHAYDLLDDTENSRMMIKRILRFLEEHLLPV